MGIQTKFHGEILHASVHGELTLEDALTHVRFLEGLIPEAIVLKELLDFGPCQSVLLTTEELKAAVRAGELLLGFDRYCLAISAPSDLQYGLSRIFQVLQELAENPFEIEIFRDRDTALDWLEGF